MVEYMGSNILELLGSTMAFFIWFFVISLFLDFKKRYIRNISIYLSGYLVLDIIGQLLLPQNNMFKFIISIYVLFFIYLLYEGKFIHKLFTFCISNCLNYSVDMFIISFTNMGFSKNLFFTTLQGGIHVIWVTSIKLILFILIYILFKNFTVHSALKINILSNSQTVILTALPAFSFITIFILDRVGGEYIRVPVNLSLYLLIASVGTITYNLVVMILIDRLILNKKYKYMHELSQTQLLIQFNHYEAIMEKMEQTRKLRHDMKNHLLCIKAIIENNEIEKARELIGEIENNFQSFDLDISSGNSIADAVLNEKCRLAKQCGIKFEFTGVLPKDNFINPLDISTIFSNALDNAIEAAQKCEGPDRFIKTLISMQGECMLISFENSVNKEIKITGKNLTTTKSDQDQHGFGLKNIYESVEKYGGDMNINSKNRIFSLEILFNKMQKIS